MGDLMLVPAKPDCCLCSHGSAVFTRLTGDVAFLATVKSFSDFQVISKESRILFHLRFPWDTSDVFPSSLGTASESLLRQKSHQSLTSQVFLS